MSSHHDEFLRTLKRVQLQAPADKLAQLLTNREGDLASLTEPLRTEGNTLMNKPSRLLASVAGPQHYPFRAKAGDVRLAVLSILSRGPSNGYRLATKIRTESGGLWRIGSSSVYTALNKLEEDGLVETDWDSEVENGLSTISATGLQMLRDRSEDNKKLWANFAPPAPAEASVQTELVKLIGALEMSLELNPRLEEPLIKDLINLRKRIFGYLSATD